MPQLVNARQVYPAARSLVRALLGLAKVVLKTSSAHPIYVKVLLVYWPQEAFATILINKIVLLASVVINQVGLQITRFA